MFSMDSSSNQATKSFGAASLAVALALLTGCGGGGGSAPTVVVPDEPRVVPASAGADLTTQTYASTAAPLVRAVLNATGNSLLDLTGGARETPQAAGGAGSGVRTLASPAYLVRWSLGRVAGSLREQAMAVESQTISCPYGGSMQITVDDADNNQRLSAGDSLSLDLLGCVLEFDLPPANGGFSMMVNVVELNSQEEPTALDVSGQFDQFTVEGFGSMDGDFRVWSRPQTTTTEHMRVRYLDTAVTEPSGTIVYKLDVDVLGTASGGSLELSGGIGLGGQTYAITPVTRFSYTNGQPPFGGALRLGDAAGDTVQLTALNALQLELAFFVSGSGTPADSSGPLLWADYLE